MMLNPGQPDFAQGIQNGMAAMRCLHAEGFGERGSLIPQAELRFPIQKITQEISKELSPLSVAAIQDPAQYLMVTNPSEGSPVKSGFWTILEDQLARCNRPPDRAVRFR
jgi:hypothetical protein